MNSTYSINIASKQEMDVAIQPSSRQFIRQSYLVVYPPDMDSYTYKLRDFK